MSDKIPQSIADSHVEISKYPILANEKERLVALQSYHILDTLEDKDFDDLTILASAICQTPVALVSLVDEDRQWFKSHTGTAFTETPRDQSFCAHAIAVPDEVLIVPNAHDDDRFFDNPLVTGDPSIVFYAGVPLVDGDGYALGSLCVIDLISRKLSAEQINALRVIAKQVVDKLELRRKIIELEHVNAQLSGSYHELAATQLKLKQAIETGKMDTWSINMQTMEVTVSDFIKVMFGFALNQEVTVEDILERVDPDYRNMLTGVLDNAIAKQLASDTEYPITNKITNERFWVKATGNIYYDANGNMAEYSGMFMDITERKLDEIRKNDFIGMVSHELKTPLTSLNGYVQLLHGKAIKAADSFAIKALDKSISQVNKMTAMINGFLNVSRLQSGKIPLEPQLFNLTALIESTIEDIAVTATGHEFKNSCRLPVMVVADLDKIGNVVSNILGNAVKYSAAGTCITVDCRSNAQEVQVSISDNGMGINPRDLEHLFERYYRVEAKHTELISGFGIGLYLCAEIIEIHKGQIWAESEPGEGSTFFFSLPLGNI